MQLTELPISENHWTCKIKTTTQTYEKRVVKTCFAYFQKDILSTDERKKIPFHVLKGDTLNYNMMLMEPSNKQKYIFRITIVFSLARQANLCEWNQISNYICNPNV